MPNGLDITAQGSKLWLLDRHVGLHDAGIELRMELDPPGPLTYAEGMIRLEIIARKAQGPVREF